MKRIDSYATESEPLWVAGLALLCVFAGALFFGVGLRLRGEAYDWALYLTMGTLFPALLLMCALPSISLRFTAVGNHIWKAILAGFVFLIAAEYLIAERGYYVLAISLIHLMATHYCDRKSSLKLAPVNYLIRLVVIFLAWSCAVELLWWSPITEWFIQAIPPESPRYQWLNPLIATYKITVFVSCSFFVFRYLNEERDVDMSFRFRTVLNMGALVLFAVASLRSETLFSGQSFHHWGAIVGPAEMVRQGGWLLWDVPSQYGFLSTLTIAVLPGNVWQSMYVLNAGLLLFSAILLFYLLRSARGGVENFVFSFAVTFAAVFLLSGYPTDLIGPQFYPSVGAFRFFWVYALLGTLVWEHRSKQERPAGKVLILGCIVWILGMLWSSESAIYSVAVWIPAYLLLVLRRTRSGDSIRYETEARQTGQTILWLAMPVLMFAGVIGLIASYYLINLGHAPDWYGFVEYALSFTSGFFSLPIEFPGPVMALFLVFCLISTYAALFLKDGLRNKPLTLITGVWGAVWVASSYFVSRSHPNNATSLTPVLCLAVAIIICLLPSVSKKIEWVKLTKMSLMPVIVVLLTVTFGNIVAFARYAIGKPIIYDTNIARRVPPIDESLLELLRSAHVTTEEPLVYNGLVTLDIGDNRGNNMLGGWSMKNQSGDILVTPYRTWLPTMPYVLMVPLKDERKATYMERFIQRAQLGGWLIQAKTEIPFDDVPWLRDLLLHTHRRTSVLENEKWQLIRLEVKEQNQD